MPALPRSLRRIWNRHVRGFSSRRFGSSDPLSGTFRRYVTYVDRPVQVLLDTTNRCNLRCAMCYFSLPELPATPMQRWTRENLATIEREVFPFTRHVQLSAGAEPLVWKHFPELLDAVERAGVAWVEMITNGTLLTEELCRRIVEIDLKSLQISIDAATAQTYESIRHGARFEELLERIEILNAAKRAAGSDHPTLRFSFVLMRRNVGELGEFLEMAKRLGGAEVSLAHVYQNPGCDMERESLTLDKTDANRHLDAARARAEELGIRQISWPPNFAISGEGSAPAAIEAVLPTGELRPAPRRLTYPELPPGDVPEIPFCRSPWTQMNIRPDGSVFPCCFWYTPEDNLGNAFEDPFEDIWEGERYRRLRWGLLAGRPHRNCALCPALAHGNVDDDDGYRPRV